MYFSAETNFKMNLQTTGEFNCFKVVELRQYADNF